TFLASPPVTVSSADAGVTLRYTTDGSDPTTGSSTIASGGTLSVNRGLLRVKAFKTGILASKTKTAAYQVGPQVVTGAEHTLALKSDGTVWSWGNNAYGQLGIGSNANHTIPVPVSSLSGVSAIAAG